MTLDERGDLAGIMCEYRVSCMRSHHCNLIMIGHQIHIYFGSLLLLQDVISSVNSNAVSLRRHRSDPKVIIRDHDIMGSGNIRHTLCDGCLRDEKDDGAEKKNNMKRNTGAQGDETTDHHGSACKSSAAHYTLQIML